MPTATAGSRHIWNQYVIRSARRDELKRFLESRGVGCEIYYPVALHQQQCFAYLNHKAGDFPVSEQAAAQTLALPIYPELEPAQLQYVVDQIADFCG